MNSPVFMEVRSDLPVEPRKQRSGFPVVLLPKDHVSLRRPRTVEGTRSGTASVLIVLNSREERLQESQVRSCAQRPLGVSSGFLWQPCAFSAATRAPQLRLVLMAVALTAQSQHLAEKVCPGQAENIRTELIQTAREDRDRRAAAQKARRMAVNQLCLKEIRK